MRCLTVFQFTTSQGGRLYRPGLRQKFPYLSIHDLTRRSTVLRLFHGLTIHPFNSRPHKEVDLQQASCEQVLEPFNSRPHKEVDQRKPGRIGVYESFNSRPHKEVDIHGKALKNFKISFNSRPHKEVDLVQALS